MAKRRSTQQGGSKEEEGGGTNQKKKASDNDDDVVSLTSVVLPKLTHQPRQISQWRCLNIHRIPQCTAKHFL